MIIFLCILLFAVIAGWKSDSWHGSLLMGFIILALLLSILRVGGWI
jgi:hypothetical protein